MDNKQSHEKDCGHRQVWACVKECLKHTKTKPQNHTVDDKKIHPKPFKKWHKLGLATSFSGTAYNFTANAVTLHWGTKATARYWSCCGVSYDDDEGKHWAKMRD